MGLGYGITVTRSIPPAKLEHPLHNHSRPLMRHVYAARSILPMSRSFSHGKLACFTTKIDTAVTMCMRELSSSLHNLINFLLDAVGLQGWRMSKPRPNTLRASCKPRCTVDLADLILPQRVDPLSLVGSRVPTEGQRKHASTSAAVLDVSHCQSMKKSTYQGPAWFEVIEIRWYKAHARVPTEFLVLYFLLQPWLEANLDTICHSQLFVQL